MKLEEITEDEFISYLEVQRSGVINMLDIANGCELSGLDRETYKSIIDHYDELVDLYPDKYNEMLSLCIDV